MYPRDAGVIWNGGRERGMKWDVTHMHTSDKHW